MNTPSDDTKTNVLRRIGSQPVALAAGALIVLVLGAGSIGLWRAATGNSPEQERVTSFRQMQARATQASEQLFEKTKGLETSQQESIDQLQTVQEQLQVLKRLVTAQQADTKRLSEQVGGLAGTIDTLRQSFASAQSSEPSAPQVSRKSSSRAKPSAVKTRHAARAPGKKRGRS
jgi:chromosome segregation ATPase